MVLLGSRRKAPWPDFSGAAIFEGDTIIHPTGQSGIVTFLPAEKATTDQWRVSYLGDSSLSRLCLQVGDKGLAVVIGAERESLTTFCMARVKAALLFAWDFAIPRFVTEEVALRYVGDDFTTTRSEWDDYEIACSLSDVEPGEIFDGIATVDCFQAFGFGFAYRIGDFRAFVNPHGARRV